MYRCLCGAVFDRPNILRETDHYYGGFYRRTKYLLCPSCGLGDQYFDEITKEGEDDDEPESDLDSTPGGVDL